MTVVSWHTFFVGMKELPPKMRTNIRIYYKAQRRDAYADISEARRRTWVYGWSMIDQYKSYLRDRETN